MMMRAMLVVCLVSSAAWAKPKAQALCGVIVDGSVETVVPTKDNRKLDKPVSCALHVDGDPNVFDGAAIAVIVDGNQTANYADYPEPGKDFEATLSPGTDFPSCKSFTIAARLFKDQKQIWEQKIAVKQVCPPEKAKPQASKRGDGTDWGSGQRESLPDEDAAGQIDSWLQMYVYLDNTFFDSWPKDGVQIKGKTITPKNAQKAADAKGGLYFLTGIMPITNCKDEEHDIGKHPENCQFGEWVAIVKNKTELSIYSPSMSGYGKFPTAVFKKKGDRWVWTSVGSYDTGEP